MNPLFSSVVYHYVARTDEFSRIWANTPESFISHVDYFQRESRCIGVEDLQQGRLTDNDKHLLMSFDDGLKEHCTYFARVLHERGIKALFDVPTCIFADEPANPQIIHFMTAKFGIRRTYSWLDEHVRNAYPQFIGLLPSEPHAFGMYDLLGKIKNLCKKELPPAESREIQLWLYRTYLLPAVPDFMRRVYLTKDEVRTIRSLGHTIGGHSHTHGVMSNIERDPNLLARELVQSKQTLEDIVQEEITVFTYPFGSPDEVFEKPEVFRELGFSHVFTTTPTSERFDPMRIGRYSTYSTDTPAQLEKEMRWSPVIV